VALFFLDECSAAAAAGERRFMCIPCTGKSESRNDSPGVCCCCCCGRCVAEVLGSFGLTKNGHIQEQETSGGLILESKFVIATSKLSHFQCKKRNTMIIWPVTYLVACKPTVPGSFNQS